jgi:hypothetical protein
LVVLLSGIPAKCNGHRADGDNRHQRRCERRALVPTYAGRQTGGGHDPFDAQTDGVRPRHRECGRQPPNMTRHVEQDFGIRSAVANGLDRSVIAENLGKLGQ